MGYHEANWKELLQLLTGQPFPLFVFPVCAVCLELQTGIFRICETVANKQSKNHINTINLIFTMPIILDNFPMSQVTLWYFSTSSCIKR